MKSIKSIQALFVSILLIAAFSFSSFAKAGNRTDSKIRFRIPTKIISVTDLPEHLRQETQKKVVTIQLFPEEVIAEVQTEVADKMANESELTAIDNTIGLKESMEKIVETDSEESFSQLFHIVTGSFKFKTNAEVLANDLRKLGYGNTYVEFYDEAGFYRVIVQQHNNKEEANYYLKEFRIQNPQFELAWLYQGKKLIPEYYAETSLTARK